MTTNHGQKSRNLYDDSNSPEFAVGVEGQTEFVALGLADVAPLRGLVAPATLPLGLVAPGVADTNQLHWTRGRGDLQGKKRIE